jgi:two-component system sensor histidine kinase/response regulator
MSDATGRTPAPEYLNTALAALQHLPDSAVLVFDADLRYVLVAGQGLSRSSFDPAKMEGRLAGDVLSAEQWSFWEPLYRDAVRGTARSVETRGIDQSRWYHVDVGPWMDGSGETGGLVLTRDITDRKRAQDRFEGLLESAPDAIVVVDEHGVIVLVNAQAEKLFGYARTELLDQPVEMLVPASARGGHPERRSGYTADPHARGMASVLELRGRRKDGTEFPIENSLSPLETEAGTLISSAIRDVSERRRLEGLAGHLRAVVESSADAIITKTLEGTIVSWNPGAVSLYGYSEAEAVGQSISMLVPPGHGDEVARLVARVGRGESVDRFDTVRRCRDGSLVDVSLTLSAVRDATGRITAASTIARDITERKRGEAALAEARADIDRFFALSRDVMAIANEQGHFVRVNPAFQRTLGYSLHELTGRPFGDFVHADDLESTLANFAELFAGASTVGFEIRHRCKSGAYRWLLWNASAAEGGFVYCTAVDVTERKQMEDSVREAEELLSLAFEHSPHGMTLHSPDRRVVRVNRAFADMLGYTVQEILDGEQTAQDRTHPDDVAADPSHLQPLIDGETDRGQWEKRFIHADGHTVWARVSVSALRYSDGAPRLMIAQVEDISARRRIEQELRASEQRLALAQRAAGVGTWDWNVTTDVIFWAAETEEIYGLPPGGFAGRYENWSRTVHPDDLPIAEAGLRHTVETHTDWHQDFRITRADGAERWIAASGRPYVDEAGECHVVGVNLDVTERKLAERQLAEAARFFDVTSDMVCTAGFDGFFKTLNGRWEQTLGWSADELLAQPYVEFVHPDDRPDTSVDLDEAVGGQSRANFTNRYRTKDGRWRWLEWNSATAYEEAVIYASARDVTVRVEAESAILLAEAAAAKALGEALEASAMKSAFLANMSHEVRTPLNGVIGMADLLLDSSLDRDQREHARLLKTAGETLVAVVDDILEFSKIEAGATRLESVDLDLLETVEDACDLIADTAQRKGVELTLDLDPELPEIVRGDAVRLRQIITNLLTNAVKFTAAGEVRVRLRALDVTASATQIRFEVTDTGIGIDADRLDQMFERFIQEDDSTTRRFGGTGLGLAIVKQLVEMMDGEVGVTSARGAGSTFWFTLPLEHGGTGARTPAGGPPAGTRLLVVDDNETNRRLLVQLAHRWQLPVTAVPDAAQALTELRDAAAREEPFDCVALDMHMPGTDGIQLARAIRRDETFPTPGLVMLTSTLEQRRKAREAGIDVHLTKPVRRSRLQSALAEALGMQTGRRTGAAELDPGEAPQSSPLILIVEDNDINQILVVRMLERRGYRADVAADGREALTKLEAQSYAAVLMDCQMPELSGYDATRELRDREAGRFITPVIAMTANALRGDREKCLASGMDDYLSKPLKPKDLDRALRRWAPRQPTKHDSDRPGTPEVPDTSTIDLPGIEAFLRESGDAAQTLIEIFGTQTSLLLTQMRTAIEASDTASLREKAHKLHGSCVTLAAGPMAEQCKLLENLAREGTIEGTSPLVDQIETAFSATYDALIAQTKAP